MTILVVMAAACGLHMGGVSPLVRHTPRAMAPRLVATPFSQPVPAGEDSGLKILYDGQCMVRDTPHQCCFACMVIYVSTASRYLSARHRPQVCLTNKAILTFFDWRKQKRLNFVDIRDENYSPSKNGGVKFADAMRHFHVVEGTNVRAPPVPGSPGGRTRSPHAAHP